MAKRLLCEKDLDLCDQELIRIQGEEQHNLMATFMKMLRNRYDPEVSWRYYDDEKAWLCRIYDGKKTWLWLSLWEGFFRVSFYFTQKTGAGIQQLDIDEGIKEVFRNTKPVGKLIPLTIDIREEWQLKELGQIIEYKKSLR